MKFFINLNKDGFAKSPSPYPPISFSHVTSTNLGIIPQNLPTFSLNPFDTLV